MINDRIARIGDYPFDRLRALLDPLTPRAGAAPISLALGEPQHTPPEMLRRIVDDNADLWGSYPPMWGTADFRAAVADWLSQRYRLAPGMVDPDRHVLPVSGTREALFMVAFVVVPERCAGGRPAVLMPNPFYQVYLGGAALAGAEPVYLPATRATGFLPDFTALDEDLLRRTAMADYCSPANPQGAVADLDTLKRLVALAREHDFVLVADECYSEIYDEIPPPGMLEACAALGDGFDNVLVFQSLSKRSSAPGLRSGFVAGDGALIATFKRVRDYGGAPPPLPLLAASAALWRDEAHVEANRALYREKFDRAEVRLGGRFGFARPAGAFYLWLDVGDGEAAAAALWREAALRVIPGAYLARGVSGGANPGAAYIRAALVHDIETTEDALDRLSRIL